MAANKDNLAHHFLAHHLEPIRQFSNSLPQNIGTQDRISEIEKQISAITSDIASGPVTLTDRERALFDEYRSLLDDQSIQESRTCYLRGIVEGIHLTKHVGLAADSLQEIEYNIEHLAEGFDYHLRKRERAKARRGAREKSEVHEG